MLDPLAAKNQLGALLHALVDVAQYPLQLTGIDHRAQLGGWVQRVANPDRPGHLEHLGNELGADTRLDDQPRRRHANFALIEEHRPRCGGRGFFQVAAVIENDVRRLAATLEPDPLHVRLAGVLQKQLADFA
ncbi:hypothetical protein D9M71_642430 [compost metagenome]